MLGKAIKAYIDERGLKQKKIAELANLSEQQLSDIFCGRRKIEAMEYFRICRALGVNVDYFQKQMEETA